MAVEKQWSTRAVYGFLVLTMAAWGGTFVAGRLVALECPPLTAAFWRFVLAALVLAPLAVKKEGRLIPRGLPRHVWGLLAGLGVTGMFGYNFFFIKGLGLTEAGRASVIVAMNPGAIYLGTVLFFGEKLTGRGLAGFSCALFGAALVISRRRVWTLFAGQVGPGEMLMFGCVLCWAAYSLLGKMVLGHLTPLMATAWACLFGLAFLAPGAWLESGPAAFLRFSPTAWLSLAFLGVAGTALGFTLYYLGIDRLGAGGAGIFINLVPVFAIVSGWLILGERLDWSLAAGLLLVLAGIRLSQRG
jgi:drug/metabolite transporter (DMT)-like permease